jgi:TPR repeat protein
VRATALYTKGCDGDFGRACFNLAWQYARGIGAAFDDKRARALFERSCLLGDGSGCDELARRDGKNGEYCERWGIEACFAVAEEVSRQQGETAAAAEAIVVAGTRACNRGHSGACNVLGHLARDFIRQCDAGNNIKDACMFAGLFYARGLDLPPLAGARVSIDRARALAAFKRSCAQGATVACEAAKRVP